MNKKQTKKPKVIFLELKEALKQKSLTADVSQLNPYQLSAFKSLKNLFSLKWQAVGTTADEMVFEEFIKQNISIPTLNFHPNH
ncbi:MAG TPA: hypothetical protein VK772_18410 [Puia sp.]|jgi:hypothetical protein|nr:hypothetical protein [Puia sp.]